MPSRGTSPVPGKRDTQGFLRNRNERRVGIVDRLFAVPPPEMRKDHAAGDGLRPDDAHLDDQPSPTDRDSGPGRGMGPHFDPLPSLKMNRAVTPRPAATIPNPPDVRTLQ
jgi:hypothetical protein